MPWNSTIEAEYDALLAGSMGAALQGSANDRQVHKDRIRAIETSDSSVPDPVFASNVSLMTPQQARSLWLWRVAFNFYMERNNWWPWRLRDKSAAELIPLLNFGWQGFTRHKVGKNTWHYSMESVWDDRPEMRALEAFFALFFWALTGETIETEADLVSRIIQGMRDAGWKHVTGFWENYAGFPRRSPTGGPTFNFDDIASLKAGECHINSNYLVARLRSFNIPAHVARAWLTLPGGAVFILGGTTAQDWHQHGHCFIHFPTLQSWLTHGDDVQGAVLASIPPLFAMKSEWWMHAYHFGETQYEWTRASDYDAFTWWCLLIGRSPNRLDFDVPFLHRTGQLRSRLENVHIDNNYAGRVGAPSPVPPLFTVAEVDTLVNWVAAKLG